MYIRLIIQTFWLSEQVLVPRRLDNRGSNVCMVWMQICSYVHTLYFHFSVLQLYLSGLFPLIQNLLYIFLASLFYLLSYICRGINIINKFKVFKMDMQLFVTHTAVIVGIISRCALTIEACRRNHTNKSKLVLCKLWIHLYSHLKQLRISNKMECFSYKGGCGIHGHTLIKMFKSRAGLRYR